MKIIVEKKKKGDRCTRIAKRKYDVWPSAYASGAVVKCRQGKIWKGLTEEELTQEIFQILAEELQTLLEKKKPDFKKEKESGLHGWFSRKGGPEGSGWVDCNTCRTDKETGKKTCKTCGRQEGEKRAKYPACRPKPSDCGSSGKGKEWGKKSESIEALNNLLEEDRQYLKNIVINEFIKILELQEVDLKAAAQQAIKDATIMRDTANKELQGARNNASVAQNSGDPGLANVAKKQIIAADANKKYADEKLKDTKRAASETQPGVNTEETVTEQESTFQLQNKQKHKARKIRLLTKGKQDPGSAYPNKAPMERSKSAPPGAGGS